MSGDWLGDLKPSQFKVIFVTDCKPYWRSEYLLRPDVISIVPRKSKQEKSRQRLLELLETVKALVANGDHKAAESITTSDEYKCLVESLAIHYKAGRKFPEYSFKKLKSLTYQAIRDQGWLMLGQIGYEADDIAATIVKVNNTLKNPNRLILVTIDSDWIGLVNDYTAWFCMHGYSPRIRSDNFSCNDWVTKKLKTPLTSFREIWDIKGVQGDKSDNIPPSQGALLPVIDLLNPPKEFRLWEQPLGEEIRDLLESRRSYKVDPRTAIEYMDNLGISYCIRPLDIEKDFAKLG